MLLTPDQEMIRDAVRDFAQRELWPHAPRWDKEHHFPHHAHRGLPQQATLALTEEEENEGRAAAERAGIDLARPLVLVLTTLFGATLPYPL